MIFTAPIAGLGLMLTPTNAPLPEQASTEPPAVTAPAPTLASPATPAPAAPTIEATPPAATGTPADAAPAPADPATNPAVTALKAETANPAPLGTCHVCGPVYATRDPLIGMNRVFYAINQPIDRFIFRPPAMVYKAVVPRPAREGVRNALSNIYSPVTFLNDVVQLRPKRALNTLGRFLINSTLGIGGLFDIAKRKPFHLQGHTNSFSNSLAMLGMTSGPYLYLPFIGPSSFRDMLGAGGDTFAQPLLVNRVYSRQERTGQPLAPAQGEQLQLRPLALHLRRGAGDAQRAGPAGRGRCGTKGAQGLGGRSYVALREAYLQNREAEVAAIKAKDGRAAPVAAFDDPLADPAAPSTPDHPLPATPDQSPAKDQSSAK
jgi:phospholipid-binding lipoprotein MlaA